MNSNEKNQTVRIVTRREILGAAAGLGAMAATVTSVAEAVDTRPGTVLITGSNRGIGWQFARQYTEAGWHVIATCRRPAKASELKALAAANDNVTIEALDVTDHAGIDELAKKYADTPIDLLLNNAGISGGFENQNFGSINYDIFGTVMAVNALAPLKMAEAFLAHVEASDKKKIMTVSSSQGSIGQVRAPRLYFYRSSKSAVNMHMRNLALALKRRGVIVGLVTPGATDTDLMKGLPIPLRDPAVATADMIRNIAAFALDSAGSFVNYDGEILPW